MKHYSTRRNRDHIDWKSDPQWIPWDGSDRTPLEHVDHQSIVVLILNLDLPESPPTGKTWLTTKVEAQLAPWKQAVAFRIVKQHRNFGRPRN